MTTDTLTVAPSTRGATGSIDLRAGAPVTSEDRAARPTLVSPGLDGWLVGGFAIVAWVVFTGVPGLPTVDIPALRGAALWVLLGIIATHFGVSYHLAYGQGRAAVLRHRWMLVVVPVVLVAFATAVVVATAVGSTSTARQGARLALVSVYSLTTWHYVKQTYGVARVGAAIGGIRLGPSAARTLRYGLYPLWLSEAATVWSRGYVANDYGFDASFTVFPEWTVSTLRSVSVLSAVAIALTLLGVSMRQRVVAPATMWSPYVVAFLWIVWQPDHISAVLVLGAAHALQYLACAHRAEVAWGTERCEPRTTWWCSVFGGALATGMILTYWLPMWLGHAGGATLGVTMAAMVFVVFNLHHYAIDAVIWRARDGHVRRIVRGR